MALFVKSRKKHPVLRELSLPVCTFALILVLVLIGVRDLSGSTEEQFCEMVREAVTRAAVQCYALEGAYPPSVAYLEEHYGLAVDTSRCVLSYEYIGGNLMPQIAVFPLED